MTNRLQQQATAALADLSADEQQHLTFIIQGPVDDLRHFTTADASEKSLRIARAALLAEQAGSKRATAVKLLSAAIKRWEAALAEITPTEIVPLDQALAQDWADARDMLAAIKLHGRLYLVAQVLLGWKLVNIKQALGFAGSGSHKKQKFQDGTFNRTWEDWTRSELGIPKTTSHTFERVYEAARLKMKRLGGHQHALRLLAKDPSALCDQDTATLEKLVAKITDGETQRSLLIDLKLVKTPPTGHGGNNHGDGDKPKVQPTMQQLALSLFSAPVHQISLLRTHSDYKAALNALPVVSDDEDEVTLSLMEAEAAALLEDIRRAKARAMQAAKK